MFAWASGAPAWRLVPVAGSSWGTGAVEADFSPSRLGAITLPGDPDFAVLGGRRTPCRGFPSVRASPRLMRLKAVLLAPAE